MTPSSPPARRTGFFAALVMACASPERGKTASEVNAPRDSGTEPTDTTSPADASPDTAEAGADTGTPPEEAAPCGTVRQAWPPVDLEGHTPWFLHAGERVLLGTTHDSAPAHVLQWSDDALVDLGAPSETETAIWQIVEVDGEWYGGTYPNAKLVRQGEDLGSLWDGASSAFTLAAAHGWIYAGLGPERAAIAAYELATGETRVLEGTRMAAYGEVHRGRDGQVYGLLDGERYRLSAGEALPVAAAVSAAVEQTQGLWLEGVTIAEPASLELSIQLRDPETWEVFTPHFGVEGRGLAVHALGASAEHIIGGTLLPNELFSLEDDTLTHLGHVGDGEMYSILVESSRVWMAEYPSGDLWTYDPTADWALGTNPSSQDLGEGHLRPLALESDGAGRIWVGSVAGYGVAGGALARVADGEVTNYRAPFEDVGVSALAWDAETGWLAVAADGLWLWDVASGRVAHTLEIPTPWVMKAVDGVLYALSWEMELTVVDLRTREVIHREATGLGNSRRHALWLHEDALWGAADWGLFTIDLQDHSLTARATAPVTIDVGGALAGGTVTFASGSSVWSVDLDTLQFTEHGAPVSAADVYDHAASGDDVLALLKTGDSLSVVAVEICDPERRAVIELLDNGDFEAGLQSWEQWGGTWGEALESTDPVYTGSSALQITAGASGGHAFQTIAAGLEGEVAAGAWIWLPAEGAPERLQFELWLYGVERYAWGRTELDLRSYPREEWVLVGPFNGTITADYTDSYVHLGILGESGAQAFFDDVSLRRYP